MKSSIETKINVLYLHNRPSGGAGESLYQMIYDNNLWNTKGVVFMNNGFLRKKYDALKPQIKSDYINGSSWLGAVKNKKGLFVPTKIYQFPRHYSFYTKIKNLIQKENINVIHTNTINIIEGGILGKNNNIPHFVQVRELLDLDYYSYPVSKKWIVNRLQQYSDILIANSERTRESLLKLNVNDEKIRVIYNTVSATPKQLDIRDYLKLARDTKIVAIVGWITPNKMIEDFLATAKEFQDKESTKFVIIGDYGFDASYNNKIKNKLENASNVINAGLITNATEYMSSFDILMCPCYTESFGRTVAEALITGTPAIGVSSCAVGELVQHGKSGFVAEKSDIESFVKHTRQLLDNDDLRAEMGRFAKLDAEKRFGLNTIRNQYLELYKEFVNKS